MSEILSIIEQNIRPEASRTSLLGSRGEQLAVEYLVRHGYRIVITNFKVPVGRNSKGVQVTGEIDVIALEGDTLCFIEVKSRSSDEFTPVITAVDLRKQRQITRTARVYRRMFGVREIPYRFDVVTVLLAKHKAPEIALTRGFWTEASFRKRSWEAPVWQEFA